MAVLRLKPGYPSSKVDVLFVLQNHKLHTYAFFLIPKISIVSAWLGQPVRKTTVTTNQMNRLSVQI